MLFRSCPVSPTNTSPGPSAPHFPLPSKWRDAGAASAAFRYEVHTYPSAASRLLQTHVFKESLLLLTPPHLGAAVLPRLRRWLQVSSERPARATAAAVATGILAALGRPPFPSLRPPGRACSAEPEPRVERREGGDPRLRVFSSRRGTGGGSSRWSELPRRAALGLRSTPAARAGAGPLGWSPCPARSTP